MKSELSMAKITNPSACARAHTCIICHPCNSSVFSCGIILPHESFHLPHGLSYHSSPNIMADRVQVGRFGGRCENRSSSGKRSRALQTSYNSDLIRIDASLGEYFSLLRELFSCSSNSEEELAVREYSALSANGIANIESHT